MGTEAQRLVALRFACGEGGHLAAPGVQELQRQMAEATDAHLPHTEWTRVVFEGL